MSEDHLARNSTTAINAVVRALGTLAQLTAAVAQKGGNAIDSCNITMGLIMEAMNNNPLTPGRKSIFVPASKLEFWSNGENMPMSNEQLVTEILGLLGQPVAIGMSISKDHHFVLLPIDDNNISILQGFQGSYTLVDWLAWRGIGLIPKAEFRQALRDLLSDSQRSWTNAALKLFSFALSKTPGATVVTAPKVAQDIADWFNQRPFIVSYCYKQL